VEGWKASHQAAPMPALAAPESVVLADPAPPPPRRRAKAAARA
jgi:hypothetical protein